VTGHALHCRAAQYSTSARGRLHGRYRGARQRAEARAEDSASGRGNVPVSRVRFSKRGQIGNHYKVIFREISLNRIYASVVPGCRKGCGGPPTMFIVWVRQGKGLSWQPSNVG
jgi:hypothetical protein